MGKAVRVDPIRGRKVLQVLVCCCWWWLLLLLKHFLMFSHHVSVLVCVVVGNAVMRNSYHLQVLEGEGRRVSYQFHFVHTHDTLRCGLVIDLRGRMGVEHGLVGWNRLSGKHV
ncbi:hypothetical protein BC829DRAFT_386901 [Chytridium lagenaria]|nr:hypothetical protein BC829DRAFT_386901 [Chytridium lagenaria]